MVCRPCQSARGMKTHVSVDQTIDLSIGCRWHPLPINLQGNKYSNAENATHGRGFRCNSDLIQHVMQSSRRIGHLFVEAREHMNSEFGIFERM